MKITEIKSIVVNGGNANWVFVKVITDAGIAGIGEATLMGRAASIVAAIEDMTHYVVGRNPLRIEHIWQSLFRFDRFRGGPIQFSALSGIDMALWDILGKHSGLPVYQLLGGAFRDRVQLYGKIGDGDPEEAAERATELVEKGYRALKFGPGENPDPRQSLQEMVNAARRIRDTVGDDVEILIDMHGRFDVAQAIWAADALGEIRPYFLEEPVALEDWDGLARLSARTNVPLATGERLHGKYSFGRLIDRGYAHFVQPDVCNAGGITELSKIAAMAEARHLRVAPHNPSSHSELATMASVHFDAAIPNFAIQEHPAEDPPWRYEIFDGAVKMDDEGNALLPDDRPGFGMELNQKVAAKHP
jgi:galactonate dehydratase